MSCWIAVGLGAAAFVPLPGAVGAQAPAQSEGAFWNARVAVCAPDTGPTAPAEYPDPEEPAAYGELSVTHAKEPPPYGDPPSPYGDQPVTPYDDPPAAPTRDRAASAPRPAAPTPPRAPEPAPEPAPAPQAPPPAAPDTRAPSKLPAHPELPAAEAAFDPFRRVFPHRPPARAERRTAGGLSLVTTSTVVTTPAILAAAALRPGSRRRAT
ncbi:hypothetical protein [Streptomyces sp. NPDC058739]|uniref:hypothetical protein n=1 Tax=Streptomyces sp. NPDC058739 TaxID=3346618 RepID=UPI0036932552